MSTTLTTTTTTTLTRKLGMAATKTPTGACSCCCCCRCSRLPLAASRAEAIPEAPVSVDSKCRHVGRRYRLWRRHRCEQVGRHCKQEEVVIVDAVGLLVVCSARSCVSNGKTGSPPLPPTVLSARRSDAANDLATSRRAFVNTADGFERSNWKPNGYQWSRSQRWSVSLQTQKGRQDAERWQHRPARLPLALLMLPLALLVLLASLRFVESNVIYVKVGALFEESDHEQANMFIRTIKMINVRRDETIRQLLSLSSGSSVNALNGRRQFEKMHHQQWPVDAHNASAESRGEQAANSGQIGAAAASEPITPDNVASSSTSSANKEGGGEGDGEGVIVKLEPMVEFLSDRDSSLEADGKVCQLIESGAHALIGPTEGASIQHVQSVCDNMDIPYFELRPFLGSASPSGSSSFAFVPPASSSSSGLANNGGGGGPRGFVASPASSLPQPQPIQSGPVEGEERELDQLGAERLQWSPNFDNGDNFQGNGFSRQHRQPAGQAFPISMTMMPLGAATKLVASAALSQHHQAYSKSSNPRDFFSARNESGGGDKQQHQKYHFLRTTRINESATTEEAMLADSALAATQMERRQHQQRSQGTSADSAHSKSAALTTNSGGDSSTNQSPTNRPAEDLTLNLYPPAHLLTSAYIDLIHAFNWSSFAIVYEDESSMIKLQDLFKESSGAWTGNIRLFQFNQSESDADSRAQSQASATPSGSPANSDKLNNLASQSSRTIGFQQHQVGYFNGQQQRKGGQQQQQFGQNRRAVSKNFRDIFWKIKQSGEQNILLDIKTANLYDALKHAQQVGCMTERYSYLVTSLDLHTIDFEDFKYSRTRITGFNLIQVVKSRHNQAPAPRTPSSDANETTTPKANNHDENKGERDSGPTQKPEPGPESAGGGLLFDEKYLEKLGIHVIRSDGDDSSAEQKWRQNLSGNRRQLAPSTLSSKESMSLLPSVDRTNEHRLFLFLIEQERSLFRVRLSTSSAILHDFLMLYTLGLNELDPSGSLLSEQQQTITCSLNSKPWLHGSSLVNYMRHISFTGLTGDISFDQRGLRSEFKLDLMGVAPDIGLVKVGEWHSKYANSARSFTKTTTGSTSKGGGDGGGVSNYGAKVKSTSSTEAVAVAAAARTIKAPLDEDKNDKQQLDQSKIKNGSLDLQKQQPSSLSSAPLSNAIDDKNNRNNESNSNNATIQPEEIFQSELERYKKLQADGVKITVPYTTPISRNEALLVNNVIFEHLYKDRTSQIDTLRITTKLSQPYFMLKETSNQLKGNEQYEGFAVDLVHELSKLINFKYEWHEVEDKQYGIIDKNGKWTGMIKEILDGVADLAIVDLTITSRRESAVDFTLPFMNTGISILFKKPTAKEPTIFSFLSPFSSDVWAYVVAAYCGISTVLFIVGHLSPYEWADPHPCRHNSSSINESEATENNNNNNNNGYDYDEYDPTAPATAMTTATIEKGSSSPPSSVILKNQFTLLNSFWFTIGSLMQQGSDLTPRSMSTRTIAGIWYFFTLIMISSYTANLAAFLTVEKVIYPISSVDDLSNQKGDTPEITYGCVGSGTTRQFFEISNLYKKINKTMSELKTYVGSNRDGVERVEQGKFAFFMESTSIEYIVERNCNLTQIGGLLDTKGYGIALNKTPRFKRPYRNLLSEGILHLQENGMLHMLKNRWWKERRGGGTCTDDGKGGGGGGGVTELSLANVGGVFVVLLGGLGISFLVAIGEFMWRARRRGLTRDRMCDEMISDLKFALACKSSTKPIQDNEQEKLRKQQQPSNANGKRQRQQQQQQYNRDNHHLTRQQSSSLFSQLDTIAGEFDKPTAAMLANTIGSANPATFQQQQFSGHPGNNQQGQQRQDYCDPFLLQAMLSVLKRQQQQHHRQQQQQQYLAAAVGQQPEFTGDSGGHFSASNQQQQQQRQRHELLSDGPTLSTAANYNIQPANEQVPSWIPLSTASSAALAAARFEAEKRRLMFAQQTIDLTSTLPHTTTIDSATTNIINNSNNQNFVNNQVIDSDYDDD